MCITFSLSLGGLLELVKATEPKVETNYRTQHFSNFTRAITWLDSTAIFAFILKT
jgi:hypothetical protein